MLNIILIIIIFFLLIRNNVEKMTSQTLDNKRIQLIRKFSQFNINDNELTLGNLSLNKIKFNKFNTEESSIFTRGMIVPYTLNTPPDGWAICDGSNGTPDLRNRFIVGSGQGIGLTERTLGNKGGSETHTLTTNELPRHRHSINILVNNTTHNLDGDDGGSGAWKSYGRTYLNSTGGGQPHTNMPPYFILNYIMKL